MRILYLQTFPFWGSGSGTYARHLASTIGVNHKVAILAPDDRPIDRAKLYTVHLPFPVAFTGHPEWPDCKLYSQLTNLELTAIYKTFLDATLAAVEDFKPEIIHVHHAYPLTWAAAYVKDLYGINFVTTIHGSELPTIDKDKRYGRATYYAMYRTRKIIPNSSYTKDWFVRCFHGYFHEKCRVIPGGVNIDKFVYSDNGWNTIDKELNLQGKSTILFAGKLTKYKGVEFLVGAANKIHGDIIILGDGPEKQCLIDKANALGVTNIHWVGHQGAGIKKLVPYYSRADIFIAPSTWDEPLGLVILEAMSCNRPVIVTRKGGIPLAVKEGVNGLFIRARNSSDIVEKVNYLLDHPEIRSKMGENARKIAETKFSWETIGHKFELLYKKFAKRANNGVR